MPSIRRIYLYIVAFLSLQALIWGGVGLLRLALGAGGPSAGPARLSSSLSLVLVSLPVLLLHGWLAQRAAQQDEEERFSRARTDFLYLSLAAALLPAFHSAAGLVDRLIIDGLGLPVEDALFGPRSAAWFLPVLLLNLAAAGGLYLLLRADWRLRPPHEYNYLVRRLFRYAWLVVSLFYAVAGAEQILQFLLSLPAGSSSLSLLANGLALLLVGGPVWFFTQRVIEASLEEPGEAGSLLRLAVLYLLVFVSVAGVLLAAAQVLNALIRALLDQALDPAALLDEARLPLALAAVLVGVWRIYGLRLNAALRAAPDGPRRPSLRRLYAYGLALLGLAVAFAGLSQALSYLIDQGLGAPHTLLLLENRRLARAISTLVVGVPLWIFAWRPIAREAAAEGEAGDNARRSPVRRAYLFFLVFVGLLGLMISAGQLLSLLLNAALGSPPADLAGSALEQARWILLSLLLMGYHWYVLWTDHRLAERSLARRHALFPVLVLTYDEGPPEERTIPTAQALPRGEFAAYQAFVDALLRALQRQSPALPVAVHPFNLGTPGETMSAARAVVLPSELLARPTEALRLWLQAFPGLRVVVPTPGRGWHWVLGGVRSPAVRAYQTAQMLRHLAEGQPLPAERDAAFFQPLVYTMAALFVLEVVALLLYVVYLVAIQ